MKLLTMEDFVLSGEHPYYILEEYANFLQTEFKIEWFIGEKAIFKNVEIVYSTDTTHFFAISGEQIFNIDKDMKSRIYWDFYNLSKLLSAGIEVEVVENYKQLI